VRTGQSVRETPMEGEERKGNGKSEMREKKKGQ